MYDFDEKMCCDCEKCGGLAVVDDSIVHTSIPPKYSYRCLSCGYQDYVTPNKAYYLGVKKDSTEFYKELQEEQQEQM